MVETEDDADLDKGLELEKGVDVEGFLKSKVPNNLSNDLDQSTPSKPGLIPPLALKKLPVAAAAEDDEDLDWGD
jgi:hypothetical protein